MCVPLKYRREVLNSCCPEATWDGPPCTTPHPAVLRCLLRRNYRICGFKPRSRLHIWDAACQSFPSWVCWQWQLLFSWENLATDSSHRRRSPTGWLDDARQSPCGHRDVTLISLSNCSPELPYNEIHSRTSACPLRIWSRKKNVLALTGSRLERCCRMRPGTLAFEIAIAAFPLNVEQIYSEI